MSESGPRLLIVSASGRALARSARRAGWIPLVVDMFADRDTCALAADSRRVTGTAPGFDPEQLHQAVAELDPRQSATCVYGSGLESVPVSIEALATGRRLLGNAAEVVAGLKDPMRLATLLADLGIPHPRISLHPPEPRAGWLHKQAGGSGGSHVVPARCRARRPDARSYFQEQVAGRVLGVTFVADRGGARIVGFAEQLVHNANPRHPFGYGGALALESERLLPQLRRAITDALGALVGAAGLRGLCGVDLIVDGERWWLIDVNPRPGASFELHEGESSLVQAHTDVFEGRALRLPRPPAGALRGHRIVYAGCPLTVPPQIRWPDWVCDRPWPGTRIGPGEPVCSVQASAASSAAARMLLEARLQRMKALLVRWQDHRESA